MGIKEIKEAQTLWNEAFQHLVQREERHDPNDKCIKIHRETFDKLVSAIAKNYQSDDAALIKLIHDSTWSIPGSSYYSIPTICSALRYRIFSSTEEKEQFLYRNALSQDLFKITRELRTDNLTAIEAQVGFLMALAQHRPEEVKSALPKIIEQATELRDNTLGPSGMYNSSNITKRHIVIIGSLHPLNKLQKALEQQVTTTASNTSEEEVAPASAALK